MTRETFQYMHRCSCSRTNALRRTTNNAENEPLKCSALNTLFKLRRLPKYYYIQDNWICRAITLIMLNGYSIC